MLLSKLIQSAEGVSPANSVSSVSSVSALVDAEITGITADSRAVEPGFLFIAVPGTKHDGRGFITDAIKRGAAALLAPVGTEDPGIPLLVAQDMRKAVSSIAATFYPRQPATICAITGTSGKTSTAQFTREIWAALGQKSASIGTLGLITSDESRYGSLTTPDAITLHQLLDECAARDISHVALEASSHGLALHRLDHVKIKAAAFTNLSRDHLDYHPTMEDYLAAKMRLFGEVMTAGMAVLNADIMEFSGLTDRAKERGLQVISYGKNAKDIKLIDIELVAKGQRLTLEVMGEKHKILLPLIGAFQAWNAMAALGLVLATGADSARATQALEKLTGVPGRLQAIGSTASGGEIFVDYAHKPDALENVLRAMRPHVAAFSGAKLGVVFGCGGNRDTGKRPIMGEIASRMADWTIVTDDNPRFEEAGSIRQAVLAGCNEGSDVKEIGDRAKAIEAAIARLNKGDVLVIAGKGHEPGQIVGDQTLPFDDAEVARALLGASHAA